MKIVFALLLLFILSIVSSCSTSDVELKDLTKGDKANTNSALVTPQIPLKIEPVNLDVEFNEELGKVWSNYFTEDFTDSKAMTIYVVTNRNLKQGNTLGCSDDYLGVNADKTVRNIACKINVPKNHSTGEIQIASDNRQSSHEYFKVLGIKSFEQNVMLESLKKSQRTPLVFVHGFNVKFQEAIFRAAQIAYDLKYQGPVILFSWPAGAGDGFLDDKLLNKTYKNNSQSAKDSVSVFKDFIDVLYKLNIKINLVVHSMGHQVVLPALNQWAQARSTALDKKIINELILNAPDFEINQFEKLAESIKSISKRVTLYCSFNDSAMVASEVMNKNKRLGGCAQIDSLDTVNVSLIDAPAMGVVGLGHGYYSSRPLLTDFFQVLLGIDAEKRLFIRKSEPNSTEKYYLRP